MEKVDIVIIGAGVIGLAAAHALMKFLFGAAKENGTDFCFSVI